MLASCARAPLVGGRSLARQNQLRRGNLRPGVRGFESDKYHTSCIHGDPGKGYRGRAVPDRVGVRAARARAVAGRSRQMIRALGAGGHCFGGPPPLSIPFALYMSGDTLYPSVHAPRGYSPVAVARNDKAVYIFIPWCHVLGFWSTRAAYLWRESWRDTTPDYLYTRYNFWNLEKTLHRLLYSIRM